MKNHDILKKTLTREGLKVTPQRIGVLEAVQTLHHPSAEEILSYIREHYPSISTGTVYNILDSFVDKSLVRKVKTDKGLMRYDAVMEPHHHLYCSECDRIEDYYDETLNELIAEYFRKKSILGFAVEDVKLQIVGKFLEPVTGQSRVEEESPLADSPGEPKNLPLIPPG